MNQHNVQEAYLKNFCVDGRIWVYDKKVNKPISKPASQCTVEEDFQSEILEKYQNRNIESPGIKKLRKLLDGLSINENEFELIRYWTDLHIIRNQKFRNESGIDYNSYFDHLFDIENKFSLYYRYCFKYKCPNGKYLITSDNPIIEFSISGSINRILTLSPDELILFSPINDTIKHEEIEFSEFVNSMLWAHAANCIFSNQKELPVSLFEQNIKEWNLVSAMEEIKFVIENNSV
jgi:hypothetical protein